MLLESYMKCDKCHLTEVTGRTTGKILRWEKKLKTAKGKHREALLSAIEQEKFMMGLGE